MKGEMAEAQSIDFSILVFKTDGKFLSSNNNTSTRSDKNRQIEINVDVNVSPKCRKLDLITYSIKKLTNHF